MKPIDKIREAENILHEIRNEAKDQFNKARMVNNVGVELKTATLISSLDLILKVTKLLKRGQSVKKQMEE